MTYDGQSREGSSDSVDEAFFAREANPNGSSQETAGPNSEVESCVPTRPSALPPAMSSAHDAQGPESALAPDFDEDAVLGRNRGLQIGGFFLVLVGAIGGGVAGYYALRNSAAKETPSATASASASTKKVAPPTNAPKPPAQVASADASAKTNKADAAGTRVASKAGTPSTGTNVGAGPGNVAGPNVPAATGELTQGEISGVVERNRALIRRQCWQPEVQASQGMGGSARVQTSFTIAPSGAVQSVSAHGAEDNYPGLAPCIAGRIRGWQFPPSASSTPVNLPFVFAAQ